MLRGAKKVIELLNGDIFEQGFGKYRLSIVFGHFGMTGEWLRAYKRIRLKYPVLEFLDEPFCEEGRFIEYMRGYYSVFYDDHKNMKEFRAALTTSFKFAQTKGINSILTDGMGAGESLGAAEKMVVSTVFEFMNKYGTSKCGLIDIHYGYTNNSKLRQ